MLEALDLGRKLKSAECKRRVSPLQSHLHSLQRACADAQLGTIVVFEGWEACGKGDAIRRLTRRLEPRAMRLHGTRAPRTHQLPMPWMARFWVALPSWGKLGIFDRSWYRRVLIERVDGLTTPQECELDYTTIRSFEHMLTDDRYTIVKLFLHISEEEQRRRLEEREADESLTWMVTDEHWRRHEQYSEYLAATELMLEHTETEWAPWTVVEATDPRWTRVKVLSSVARRMEAILRRHDLEVPEAPAGAEVDIMLEQVDLSLKLDKATYKNELLQEQLRLRQLALRMYRQQRSAVVVYEGWDAAGKGGNIRRITEKLDPRGYHVYQIAAPEGDDKSHHYLWRFWRRLLPPDEKQLVIFDRSWYGRVLVERVEGFATEPEWRRAFREINEFERQLRQARTIVVKFWVHISADEQLRRFEDRKETAYKRWKLTDEDWRNRQQWDAYEEAVEEMMLRTSTATALWTIIEGNNKRFARVRAARHLANTLEAQLGEESTEA